MTVPAGMWVIIASGVVATLVAALADRLATRRRAAEDALPVLASPLPQQLCEEVDAVVARAGQRRTTAELVLADPRLATHLAAADKPTAVLTGARVLVCSEAVAGARAAQAVVRPLAPGDPLVLAAPDVDAFALGVFASRHRNLAPSVVLTGEPAEIARVGAFLDATGTDLQSIRSGWLPDESWGHADLVVGDDLGTTLVRQETSGDCPAG